MAPYQKRLTKDSLGFKVHPNSFRSVKRVVWFDVNAAQLVTWTTMLISN